MDAHVRDELLALVTMAAPHLSPHGAETEAFLDRLDERHDALRELLDASLAENPAQGQELAATLWRYWWQRGHMQEGREIVDGAARVEGEHREGVLKGLGTIAFRQGDLPAAERAFHERLAMVEPAGGTPLADALVDVSRTALRRGDFAVVRRHAERAYAIASDLERGALRLPLHLLAAASRMEGRLDEARDLYLRSRALNEELGNALGVAGEDHNLMHVALRQGDRAEAERRFRSSSEWTLRTRNGYLLPYVFLDAAVLALHDRELDRAARLLAYTQRLFEEGGTIPDPDDKVELDEAIAVVKERLGDRYEAESGAGRALGEEEAIALALRDRRVT